MQCSLPFVLRYRSTNGGSSARPSTPAAERSEGVVGPRFGVRPRVRAFLVTLASCVFVIAAAISAAAEGDPQPIPALSARVTDLTGTLDAQQKQTLEGELAALEQRKGAQIAVLMVPTTEPEDIAQYAIRVFDQWKLGRKNIDDGVLLIVAKNDRRVRIEVGSGLEGAVPDAIANRIITETITPHFKLGDFDGGVEAGIDQIISVVNGEQLPAPDRKWERTGSLNHVLPLLLVVVFVGSGVLRALFGRLFGSVATGGLVGGIAWLLSHLLPIGLGAGVLGFLFALLLGSTRGLSGIGGWGSGVGGGFGGGGFGGGGGGGFSGGGGGFSGGGASGGW
jgi:uncharacterized protein